MQHINKLRGLLILMFVLSACAAPTITSAPPPTATSLPQVVTTLPPTPTAAIFPTATPTPVKAVPILFAPLVQPPSDLSECMNGQQFDRAIASFNLEGKVMCIEDTVRFITFHTITYRARIVFTNSQVEGFIDNRYQYGETALKALFPLNIRVKGKFNIIDGLPKLSITSGESIVILNGQNPGAFKAMPETPPTATPIPPTATPAPTPTPRPTIIFILPAPPEPPRIGAVCNDGRISSATGSGACSDHGGVNHWIYAN